MPEIIERGHLFIAQPPLYKVAKGRSEVYLKDNAALDDYLVDAGVGLDRAGDGDRAALGRRSARARRPCPQVRSLMAYVPRRYDPAIIEALALTGALDPQLDATARDALALTAEWLNAVDEEGTVDRRDRRGRRLCAAPAVARRHRPSCHRSQIPDLGRGAQAARPLRARGGDLCRRLAARLAARLRGRRPSPQEEAEENEGGAAKAQAPDPRGALVTRPTELLEAILAAGRKGLSVQRYKGLGEMNADQLWETTLDPTNRAMLQVEVAQADVADEIFTRLMGDVVEPRRDFIQENALNVANLDV